MTFSREWAFASANTFDVPCIAGFVQKYLLKSKVSIDPFARNKRWATYTNDLHPGTNAEHHMDAEEFCHLLQGQGIKADLVIFDPPYSPRQISECYQEIGREVTAQDTQNCALYSRCRKALKPLLSEKAIALSFGWNSQGMGVKEWEIIELLLVCHGGAHNDTICTAQRRKPIEEILL